MKNTQFRKWGVILLFALFVSACSSPVETSPELPDGFGSFSLSVDAARTILPTAPTINNFAVYTLAFTATGGGTSTSEDRTNANLATSPVILAVGTYSLTVRAYLDTEKTRLAAQGTETNIVIGSGENVAKTVTLKALSDTGEGTFSYNVTISAPNVTGAAMAITKNGAAISGSPVTLNNAGATSASLTLGSGVYNIRFTLIKNGAVKEEAVWNEILYVYRELTSSFSITFDNDYFYRTHYNVTFVYNDEDVTANTLQSVAHGGTLTAPAPTRTGYTFEGWHTDSGLTALYSSALVYNDFTLYAKWEEVPPDPTDWEAVTDSTFGYDDIQCITYGDGKFVAGGASGKMAYSTDGVNWISVTNTTFTNYILGIAYGNDKFVAVGSNGKIAYSADGITWAAVTDSTFGTGPIMGIAYGDGKFVAVGEGIAYSTDGINWVAGAIPSYISGVKSIAYGGGRFVIGGYYYRVAYSTNGINWIAILYNNQLEEGASATQYINGIAYGNGTFVAGGDRGRMGYSADGIAWNTTNYAHDSYYHIYCIAWGGGAFVAGGDGGRMAYSMDGENWTAILNSPFTYVENIRAIAYGNGRFVAVGQYGRIAVCTP